jgi:hypothetical protein
MEPVTTESVLSAFGVSMKSIVAGAVGSFVSLNFFDGISARTRWVTFFGGWALSAWLSSPITAFFELKPSVETGIALLLGLLGMSIAAKIIQTVRDTDWVAFIKSLRGGGSNGER